VIAFYYYLSCACAKYIEMDQDTSAGMCVLSVYLIWIGIVAYFATFEDLAPAAFCVSIGIPLALVGPCLFTLQERDLGKIYDLKRIAASAAVLALALIILVLTFSLKLTTICCLAVWYLAILPLLSGGRDDSRSG
jgi:peptidoglycan/LPS O-acetylase OafA/YrhL